ncbi:MAG: DNA-processing protein DprA [Leadbetterella sp.]|nr:DNA-processing protein DprA [Leadbetterella sp.]
MESNRITEELLYEIALSRLEGVGSVHFKNLVTYFGSAREVFRMPRNKLLKVSGIGEQFIKGLNGKEQALREAEKIMEQSAKAGIRILYLRSPEYPAALKEAYDAPPVLYCKGSGTLQPDKTLAIVGTRDATDYGKSVVEELVQALKGIQIISGLAYGIDITAHRAALNSQLSTVGVMATGHNTVYPLAHKKTAEEILEKGGLLVSEQPLFTKLHPQFFVARNRIIAGLSEVTLVVESGIRGGSMVTAEYANNYNKEVFAVPGDLHRKYSKGPNKLIFTNKAHLFTDAETLAEWMRWDEQPPKKKVTAPDLSAYSDEEKRVLEMLIKKEEVIIDDLAWHTGISLNRLSYILIDLEFREIIKQSPGKKFSLKNHL